MSNNLDNLTEHIPSFDESVKFKLLCIQETLLRKQADYGHGNIMNAPVDPELGVLIRLSDKLNRYKNLLEKGVEPNNESLHDTAVDIAGYGVILMMLQDKTFMLELEDER